MIDILKKALILYSSVFTLSFISYACCEDNFEIIGNGEIKAYDFKTSKYYSNDATGLITGAFKIEVNHETAISKTKTNLISSALATSCAENYKNDLVESSLKITLNKDFMYNGQLIVKGSNIKDLEDLDVSYGFGGIFLNVDEYTIIKMSFTNEPYEFRFEVETTDGMILVNSINLNFNI